MSVWSWASIEGCSAAAVGLALGPITAFLTSLDSEPPDDHDMRCERRQVAAADNGFADLLHAIDGIPAPDDEEGTSASDFIDGQYHAFVDPLEPCDGCPDEQDEDDWPPRWDDLEPTMWISLR